MKTSKYHIALDKELVRRIIIGCACLLLAGIVFFFVYFKVDHIEIQESSYYTKEEIKEMVLRGPLASNSVLAPILYTRDVEGKPFLEGFEVDQINRNTILVSVKEKQAVGCIKYLDCYVYFDRNGKAIETSVKIDRKVPYFDGLDVDSVVLGESLPIKDTVLNTAVSLVRIFEKNDMIPDHILFDNKYNISLQYGEVLAELGKDSHLEEKMSRLIAILPKISGQKGTLHLENVTTGWGTINFEKAVEESDDGESEDKNADSGQTDESGDGTEDSGDGSESTGYYDAYGNYIDGSESTGYYDAYGNYITGDGTGSTGYYDAYGNYIAGDGTGSTGYYDAYGNYIAGDGTGSTGYYDAYGNYISGGYDYGYDNTYGYDSTYGYGDMYGYDSTYGYEDVYGYGSGYGYGDIYGYGY